MTAPEARTQPWGGAAVDDRDDPGGPGPATQEAADRGWQVQRLTPALGAEIRGLDLAAADGDDLDLLGALLLEHLVVFLPDQDLSVDRHGHPALRAERLLRRAGHPARHRDG